MLDSGARVTSDCSIRRTLFLASAMMVFGSATVIGQANPRLPERGDTTANRDRGPTRAALDARRPRPRPLLAVGEGLAVNFFLHGMNLWLRHEDWADISLASWKSNIRDGWEWDVDGFQTNMFGHPYGGGFYFNAGRDNGLSFWGSAPLTFLGSATWEYFGETLRPSLNDLYMTGFGGIVFGEVGHRLGGLVRDDRGRGLPRVLRELAAIPLDPVGGFNRVVRGEFLRVHADPDERDRSPFSVDLQLGARLAVDSGPGSPTSVTGMLLADFSYGDAFARGFRRPFDVFRARVLLSPARGGINTARLRGRLFGRELTDTAAGMRHVFTVALKSEYLSGPAYKFGGPSLESGFVSDFKVGKHAHVQTELYAEWLLLGALDAPGAGSRARTYDFGPGAGVNAAASLQHSGHSLLAVRYRFAYVHSVSGSAADHRTNHLSLETSLPIGRSFGIGGYAGWYRQRSVYLNGDGALLNVPEFRAYITWHGGRGPASREAAGGSAL
jgi:Domain of unknown function (DUF3943)